MITVQQWGAMSKRERSIWMEENTTLSRKAIAYRKPIFGFGVNDANYITRSKIDGMEISCPAYKAWISMMKRVLDPSYLSKNPTYHNVTICDEWKSLSSFRKWWFDHNIDGYDLDKDMVSDKRVYSPETCVFIPKWLNNFALDKAAARGKYPIGASFHKWRGMFESSCSNPLTKKLDHLGYFKTPEAAHLAWRTRKLELALELKPNMDEIDLRIYPRVVEIINSAK